MNKDIISTEKNTDNKASDKAEKRKKVASVFVVLSFVFGGIMGIFIFVVLAKANKLTEAEDSVYLADSPLLPWVLVVIISGVLMGICLAISTTLIAKENRATALAGRKVIYDVDASVLRDPRIKQLPEVQRLLQYESVQKAFFDCEFPANDDPHLLELVEVLAKLADENGVIRL